MVKPTNLIIITLVVGLSISLYFNFHTKTEVRLREGDSIPKISAEDLFKKKQECASYSSDIEQKLLALNYQNENVVTTNHLDEIWFSPSGNTCMYSSNEVWQYLKESKEVTISNNIYDYLGSTMIFSATEIPQSVSRLDAKNAFNKRKEELKK